MKKRWKAVPTSFFYQYNSAALIIPIPLFVFSHHRLYDYLIQPIPFYKAYVSSLCSALRNVHSAVVNVYSAVVNVRSALRNINSTRYDDKSNTSVDNISFQLSLYFHSFRPVVVITPVLSPFSMP